MAALILGKARLVWVFNDASLLVAYAMLKILIYLKSYQLQQPKIKIYYISCTKIKRVFVLKFFSVKLNFAKSPLLKMHAKHKHSSLIP
jgi:hypothetical protein